MAVASTGAVLADDGVVVGLTESGPIVAVPADEAPSVAHSWGERRARAAGAALNDAAAEAPEAPACRTGSPPLNDATTKRQPW